MYLVLTNYRFFVFVIYLFKININYLLHIKKENNIIKTLKHLLPIVNAKYSLGIEFDQQIKIYTLQLFGSVKLLFVSLQWITIHIFKF